jgi:acetyl esterase/lipase
MGNVLERVPRASQGKVLINLAILKARNDGLIKTRRLAGHSTKSTLVRYQTQDRGKLVDATSLVTYPDASGDFPVLLVLHGTAGFTDACAPTKGIADDQLGGFTNEIGILASIFASFGYVTVFPDYIGLKSLGGPTGFLHPYLIGEPTAIASLDAVRAAKKLLVGEQAKPTDLVVVGGSQGGHAAAFVNRFQPHYAPELPVKGSVWDVPPSDLLAHSERALKNRVKATGNSIAFFTVSNDWYKSAPQGLGEVFKPPYLTTVPAEMAGGCSFDSLKGVTTLDSIFTPAVLQAAQTPGLSTLPPWDCYVKENSLPDTSVPKLDHVPTMMLLGELDDLVVPEIERASMQKLCAQGDKISYLECAGATHTKPLTYALDQWFDFLGDRLQGKPMPADVCTVKPAERCTSQP